MLIKECIICGKEFTIGKSRNNIAKYCSRDCQHKGITGDGNARYWLGKKRNSIWNKGKKLHYDVWNKGKKLHYTIWNKGKKMKKVPWNKGIKMSDEFREKMRVIKTGSINLKIRAELHHNWKGGTSPLRKSIQALQLYKNWRHSVFVRDNFTCQECGVRGGRLQVHHLKAFYEIIDEYKIRNIDDAKKCDKLWDLNNGKTLCVLCHKETDSYLINQHNKNKNI